MDMDIYKAYDDEINAVLKRCKETIREYPSNIGPQALEYLDKKNFVLGDSRRNSICFFLPFWMGRAFRTDMELCRKLSLGNMFGLLYFFTIDEVMDAAPGESKGQLLPLSNLFFMGLYEQYRTVFSSGSPFWKHFERYMHEWAYSVTWEKNEHWNKFKPYTGEDLVLMARKAAPLKTTCAAFGALINNEGILNPLEKLIDYYHIAIQLRDDCYDWREDLESRCCSYFLTRVMEYCGIEDISSLKETDVRKAVYIGCTMEEVLEQAKEYDLLAAGLARRCNLADLEILCRLNMASGEERAKKIRLEREAMLQGGLSLLINKREEMKREKILD